MKRGSDHIVDFVGASFKAIDAAFKMLVFLAILVVLLTATILGYAGYLAWVYFHSEPQEQAASRILDES